MCTETGVTTGFVTLLAIRPWHGCVMDVDQQDSREDREKILSSPVAVGLCAPSLRRVAARVVKAAATIVQ